MISGYRCVVDDLCVSVSKVPDLPDQCVVLRVEFLIEGRLIFPAHLAGLLMGILLHIMHPLPDLPDPVKVLPQLLSALLRGKLIALDEGSVHAALHLLLSGKMLIIKLGDVPVKVFPYFIDLYPVDLLPLLGSLNNCVRPFISSGQLPALGCVEVLPVLVLLVHITDVPCMTFVLESQPFHNAGCRRYFLLIKIRPFLLLLCHQIRQQRPAGRAVHPFRHDSRIGFSPFVSLPDPEVDVVHFHLAHDLGHRCQPFRLRDCSDIVCPLDQIFPSQVIDIVIQLLLYRIHDSLPFLVGRAVGKAFPDLTHHAGLFQDLFINMGLSPEQIRAQVLHHGPGVRLDIGIEQRLADILHVQPVLDRLIDHIGHSRCLRFDRQNQAVRHQMESLAPFPSLSPVLLDRDCRQLVPLQRLHLSGKTAEHAQLIVRLSQRSVQAGQHTLQPFVGSFLLCL